MIYPYMKSIMPPNPMVIVASPDITPIHNVEPQYAVIGYPQ